MREKRSIESDRVISPFHMIDHAISLRKVANFLDVNESKEPDTTLFHGKFLAAPILMTLAVEIALKALQCQEGKEEFDRDYNLVKLFQSLNKDTQAGLKVRLPPILDAVSLRLRVQDYCPVGAGIEKVLVVSPKHVHRLAVFIRKKERENLLST